MWLNRRGRGQQGDVDIDLFLLQLAGEHAGQHVRQRIHHAEDRPGVLIHQGRRTAIRLKVPRHFGQLGERFAFAAASQPGLNHLREERNHQLFVGDAPGGRERHGVANEIQEIDFLPVRLEFGDFDAVTPSAARVARASSAFVALTRSITL